MADSRNEYEFRYGVHFVDRLGDGKDGYVLKTSNGAAVKFLADGSTYLRELRAYRTLHALNVYDIDGFAVPQLLRNDDELLAIEMTIVEPPFVLDFAAAYSQPEYERLAFSDEVVEEREQHWAEIFGERWAIVRSLRDAFEQRTALKLLDLSLNNIRFE